MLLQLFFYVWLCAAVVSHVLYYFIAKRKTVQPKIQQPPQSQPPAVATISPQPEPEYTPKPYISLRPEQGYMKVDTKAGVVEWV